jgi:predicted ATPase
LSRTREVDLLSRAIARDGVTTVIGPPGSGKTSLARTLLDDARFELGTIVELENVTDRDGLATAIATTLGLTGLSARAARDPRWLVATIGPRNVLVVLDGVDGCIDAVREALRPWENAEARIVVTSRSALGLPQEHLVEVGPLPIAAAIELFTDAAARAGSAVTSADREVVERIVDAVDRLPLAIELAAGRLRVLDLRELAARLEADATLVGGGLDAAMKSAIDALDEGARSVLASCAVFSGAFTLRAAEAVHGGNVADTLTLLRNRSLVVADAGEVLAMRLPAFVRASGRRELGARIAELETRLFEHLAAALAPIADEYARTGAARARAAIALHRADLLAMRATDELRLSVEAGVLLAAAFAEDQPLDAREWISLAAVRGAKMPAERARAAKAAVAEVALAVRDVEGARAAIEGASARMRVLESRVAWCSGAFEAALEAAEAAERAALDDRDRTLEAEAVGLAGRAKSSLGAREEAVRLGRAALQIAREVRHPGLEARLLVELGVSERNAGALDAALASFEEAAAICDEIGASRLEIAATAQTGWTLSTLGRAVEAEVRHRHAVERGRAIGLDAELAWPLLGLGCAVLELGQSGPWLDETVAHARRSRQPRVAAFAAALGGTHGESPSTGRPGAASAETQEPLELGFADLEAAIDLLAGRDSDATGVLTAFVRRMKARSVRPPLPALESAPHGTIFVLADGGAFRVAPNPWVEIPLRSPLRRVLSALADARLAHPGKALEMKTLIDAGWPDEKILPIAARNRLYMAISKLRTLGLGDALGRSSRGYSLDPAVALERVEPR